MGGYKMTNMLLSETNKKKFLLEANALRRQKNFRDALLLYQKVLEQFGENVDLFATIASCYFAIGLHDPAETGESFSEAVAWIQRAIDLEPHEARLYASLGEYNWLGTLDYNQAVKAYRKAIELNPNNLQALVNGAALYDTPE